MTEQTSMRKERRNGRFVSAVAVAAALVGHGRWRGLARRQRGSGRPAGVTTATAAGGGRRAATDVGHAAVVERVTPAVVTIRTERKATAMPADLPFDAPLLREFFGRNGRSFDGQGGARPRMPLQRGLGSGVVLSADGYILTNHHVVENADRISVELSDRRVLTATVVGDDAPERSRAAARGGGEPADAAAWPTRIAPRSATWCWPWATRWASARPVTAGIISAKGRTTGTGDGSFQDFLQTDAPDQPRQLGRRAREPAGRTARHQRRRSCRRRAATSASASPFRRTWRRTSLTS